MTEQTYNIIMACKARPYGNVSDAVKEYLAKEYEEHVGAYNEVVLAGFMREAMYDYIDTCDRPSRFLREFNYMLDKELMSVSERIARAFLLVPVKNRDGQYINGFGEWAEKEGRLMDRWNFYRCTSDDIRRLAGDEIYDKIGQAVMDTLLVRCSSNGEIERYPDDEEILEVIREITIQN